LTGDVLVGIIEAYKFTIVLLKLLHNIENIFRV